MITPDQTEIDLGDMAMGTSKNFEITVSNSYHKTVTVGLGFGCGACTSGGWYPDNNIPAGSTRVIKAKFTPTSRGIQNKTIRLTHLPPQSSQAIKTVIRFKANVS
jgi:hypothetical protein